METYTYTALFTVHLYISPEKPDFVECGIIYANSFADAAKKIEEAYGDEMFDLSITLYDNTLFTFSQEKMPIIRQILEEE